MCALLDLFYSFECYKNSKIVRTILSQQITNLVYFQQVGGNQIYHYLHKLRSTNIFHGLSLIVNVMFAKQLLVVPDYSSNILQLEK